MYWAPILALGLGQLAFAQNGTNPENPGTTNPPDAAGFPAQLGDYQFYGCVRSSNGFPTFTLAESSDDVSLTTCATTCGFERARFFGVYDGDCYCGEDVSIEDNTRVENEFCDTICPGDDRQFCGGLLLQSSRRARRQSIPLSVLLSLYIRVSGDDGPITPEPTETLTATVTSTVTDTITTCPPEVPNCPLGPTTRVTTITATYCPGPTEVPCHGDCPHHCETGTCYCPDDTCFPVPPCHGGYCPPWVPCEGPGCPVPQPPPCHGEYCPPCEGHNCPQPPPCNGEHCPQPPSPPSPPCEGEYCPPSPPAPPCEGEHCPPECEGNNCPAPPSPPVYCEGENCPAPPSPPYECEGENCPAPQPPSTPVPSPECEGPECPVYAGAGKTLPAIFMGAFAGLVFLL